jgi:hypothetical protein
MAIDFVNRIIEEMVENSIKFKEIIQEGDYYVSDIVDYTRYTNRPNQTIITEINITRDEIFGNKKPIIGRKQTQKKQTDIYDETTINIRGNIIEQKIISNRDSIIRAYVNCFYWINNPLYDTTSRNLGFLNDLQTSLTYLFKAKIVDFIEKNMNSDNKDIQNFIEKNIKTDENFFESTLNKFRKTSFNTDGIIEYFILSFIFPNYPIIVSNNYNDYIYIFNEGQKSINQKNIEKYTTNETIYIKFDVETELTIPRNIYSIYNI